MKPSTRPTSSPPTPRTRPLNTPTPRPTSTRKEPAQYTLPSLPSTRLPRPRASPTRPRLLRPISTTHFSYTNLSTPANHILQSTQTCYIRSYTIEYSVENTVAIVQARLLTFFLDFHRYSQASLLASFIFGILFSASAAHCFGSRLLTLLFLSGFSSFLSFFFDFLPFWPVFLFLSGLSLLCSWGWSEQWGACVRGSNLWNPGLHDTAMGSVHPTCVIYALGALYRTGLETGVGGRRNRNRLGFYGLIQAGRDSDQ